MCSFRGSFGNRGSGTQPFSSDDGRPDFSAPLAGVWRTNQNGWRFIIYNRVGRMSILFAIFSTDLVETLKNKHGLLYNSHKAVEDMNRIKDLRISKGMTQSELGKLLNCRDVTVGRYENEIRGLDVPTICRLCDIFDCTADYLLGRSDRPEPELTPEEERLLAAWAAAPAEIRAIIDTALAPYKKDASASAPTA